VAPAHQKLYLTTQQEDGRGALSNTRSLTVYDLDAGGDPTSAPRSYETGNGSPQGLALDPTRHLLYLMGPQSTTLDVYALDASGEPQGPPRQYNLGGPAKLDIAVSSDGARLYLGTYPDSLEVVDLDATGAPLLSTLRSFDAGAQPGHAIPLPADHYFRFQYTPQAIYRSEGIPVGFGWRPDNIPLQVWPLGPDGNPAGPLQTFAQDGGRALAVDGAHHTLWVAQDDTFQDAFTSATTTDGTIPVAYALDSQGLPTGPGARSQPSYGQDGLLMAVGGDGTPVLLTQSIPGGVTGNQVKGYQLRVPILQADFNPGVTPTTTFPVWIMTVGGGPAAVQDLTVGQTSGPISLDSYLKDRAGQVLFRVGVLPYWDAPALRNLRVRFDIYTGDSGLPAKSLTETVQGNVAAFLAPGYGFEPPQQRLTDIETFSDHVQRVYLTTAQQVGLTADERPKQFTIGSSTMLGGEGSPAALAAEAQTQALLGINTTRAAAWQGMSPEQIKAVFQQFGLRHGTAVYAPLDGQLSRPDAYFAFKLEQAGTPALPGVPSLEQWAVTIATRAATEEGAAPGDMVDLKLADEPAWYYPAVLQEVRNDAGWLADFRAWVEQKAAENDLQPADFGLTGWDDPRFVPIGAAEAVDPGSRHLFYWTMRYFPESASHTRTR
jgi:hypothetical protein